MSDIERLQSEVEQLRGELEKYRRRELEQLRSQLEEAKAAADHYRSEAQRNADVGRQIHLSLQAEVDTLRAKLESRGMPNGRSIDR